MVLFLSPLFVSLSYHDEFPLKRFRIAFLTNITCRNLTGCVLSNSSRRRGRGCDTCGSGPTGCFSSAPFDRLPLAKPAYGARVFLFVWVFIYLVFFVLFIHVSVLFIHVSVLFNVLCFVEDMLFALISFLSSISPELPRRLLLDAPLRFAVDHCFAIKGHGTVMTGTVLAGTVSVKDVSNDKMTPSSSCSFYSFFYFFVFFLLLFELFSLLNDYLLIGLHTSLVWQARHVFFLLVSCFYVLFFVIMYLISDFSPSDGRNLGHWRDSQGQVDANVSSARHHGASRRSRGHVCHAAASRNRRTRPRGGAWLGTT
jgi:hypothetical protein